MKNVCNTKNTAENECISITQEKWIVSYTLVFF